MLASLRHDPVVGSDDQEREIDSGDACKHVAHESLVARHVDEAMKPPPGNANAAKPRSMVIPRLRSSGRCVVSVPVSALISVVLP